MAEPVKKVPRAYDSSRRREAAAARRDAILAAARDLFVELGYAATTMQAVAERAGVALDTVYASVGTKPALLAALNLQAVSGRSDAPGVGQWDFVRRVQAEPDAARKLELYARSVAAIRPRQVPLFLVAKEAATSNPEIARLWKRTTRSRARNLKRFAEELAATGRLRPGLTLDEVRDIIWATSAPESWVLLVHERGWSAARFARWLADTWTSTLLEPSPARRRSGGRAGKGSGAQVSAP